MSLVKRFKLRFVLTSIMLAFLFGGCVYDPHYYGQPVSTRHYYDPYDYYYYPGVSVYFRLSTGFYFYFDRTRWIRVRVLPSHIHLYPNDRVRLKIKSEKPYHRYDEHRKRYTPKSYPESQVDKKRSRTERETSRDKRSRIEREASRDKRSRIERESNRKKYEEYKKHKSKPDKKKDKEKDKKRR